jgi:pimeloyl-ACP methyl ester carboxylesterase
MTYITKKYYERKQKRILFLNPMASTSDYWTKKIKIQTYWKDFELIFIDYPGYIDVPFKSIATFEKLAIEIAKDIKRLIPKQTAVIGFSYGGNVAINLHKYFSFYKMVLIGSNPFIYRHERNFYKKLESSHLSQFTKLLINFCYTEIEKNENPFLHITLYSSLKLTVSIEGILQQLDHLKDNLNKDIRIENIKPLVLIGKNDRTIFRQVQKRYKIIFRQGIIYRGVKDSGHFVLDSSPTILTIIKEHINQ